MISSDATERPFRALALGSTQEKCDAIAELVKLLPEHPNPEAIGQALSAALVDKDSLVRAEAAEALGEPQLVASHSALEISLLRDTDATVRACAAESLGDIGNTASIPSLETALNDPDDAVRGYAAASLGLLGAHGSVHRITERLEVERESSRFDMHGALLRLRAGPESLDAFLTQLHTVTEEDAFRAMNVLDDLLARNVPHKLSAEPRLVQILADLRERLDVVHRVHIDELIARLPLCASPEPQLKD